MESEFHIINAIYYGVQFNVWIWFFDNDNEWKIQYSNMDFHLKQKRFLSFSVFNVIVKLQTLKYSICYSISIEHVFNGENNF